MISMGWDVKDELTAAFFWERMLQFEGLPEDARAYAQGVLELYEARLDVERQPDEDAGD